MLGREAAGLNRTKDFSESLETKDFPILDFRTSGRHICSRNVSGIVNEAPFENFLSQTLYI